MKKNIVTALGYALFGIIVLCQANYTFAQQKNSSDSLRYPLQDRRGDRFTWQNKNSFNIGDTSILHQTIEYDAKTKQYYIVEKIGKRLYRKPTYLTFKEFYELQKKAQEAAYFKLRTDALFALNKKLDRPKPIVYPSFFDRTFGLGNIAPNAANTINNAASQVKGKIEEGKNQVNGLKGKADETKKNLKNPLGLIDIKPTGNIDILMGYQGQFTNNPTLPERARRTGGFDFDMNANVGVNANIGDKLKLPINYNTQANFDFSNQIKLDYKGTPDQLLKSIEAGNIAFEAKGTLIPSATNLFGVKTSLQFGKLTFTAALANQRSTRQDQTLQGGASVTPFQKKLSEYEENRHFLVAQHFRRNFNTAMSKLPIITSQINISRIEVWVTNRNGATVDARDVIGFTDLAEGDANFANPIINPNATVAMSPFNGASVPNNINNGLYQKLASDPNNRIPSQVNGNMVNLGLQPVRDYEKTFARKLTTNEYTFNPQLGMLSLNSQLLPDEVLGVAYEYSLNGKVYKVGEFSQEVALDTATKSAGVQKMLFLKLLKATSARVQLPIWRLMMKNVYSLDMVGISREDFKLNILYDQPSGGLNRYLPQTNTTSEGKPIISLIGLDRLNNRNDPQPDGQFDFVESFTIYSQYGRIILPKLEPFGADLKDIAYSNLSPDTISQKYIYPQLYDSIKAIAQTYANLDRFVMQGQSKGSGGSEIYLNGYNIPPGSVRINAGGRLLTEGSDYTIDYNLGQVKILNQAILNSGVPVQVSYENNATFGIQQKGFLGLRLDYKANKKFHIGATMERLNERPFFTKQNIGEDPVRNTIYGVDFSFKSDVPKLTKWLDKLPFYSTKTMSTITAYGEGAYFKPGHPPQIGSGGNGLIYIDDFEGTRSSLDLRFPLSSWTLASTPQGVNYPEAILSDSIPYGYNRAKLAWYNIETNLQDKNSNTNPLKNNLKELSDPRVRQVYTNELFPQQTTNITNTQTQTFDLSYYPEEIGPYNYLASSQRLNSNGTFKLQERRSKWGGIMRSIDQTDFETNNFEFIEFWVQDPFLHDSIINNGVKRSGGKLKINLGNISEDILKDGKRFYENGMPTPTSPAQVDSSTTWGRVPTNPIQVTSAFSNDPNDRVYQDVGFDGLDDAGEKRKRQVYLDSLTTEFGSSAPITLAAISDPSHDNYVWYRQSIFDDVNAGILERYKNFNNPQGNSPIAGGGAFSPAATLTPDNEDLNRDNTLNETEQYYEYDIDILPGMDVNQVKYITDKRTINVKYANGTTGKENWFLFRIPLKDFSNNVGGMTDFKSIRFMRMYLTGWDSAITFRFARLDLVRNQWRTFNFEVDTVGGYYPVATSSTNPSTFNVLAVNLEENSNRTPVNYVIPPGIERVQQLSNNGVNLLLNEQALSMRFNNLLPKQSRAVFKTLNMDIRQYGKLRMFAHLDQPEHPLYVIKNNDMNLVVRIGQDFLSNYYEVRIPLQVTAAGKYNAASADKVWPDSNNLDINMQDLIAAKVARNSFGGVDKIYRQIMGNKTISVFGNPNLGEVRGILVGVENTNGTGSAAGEVWINELRLSDINEVGAYAALGRVDVQLADLGKLSVSVNTHTQGFGSIESKIGQRSRDNLTQFDAALSIDAGKLLPKEAKLSVPVYASISKTTLKPQFDPYDKDILYNDKVNSFKDQSKRDSIKNISTDQTTIKTINVTNLRVAASPKPKLWSLSNFDFSFSYTQTYNTSPTVAENKVDKYRGTIGYNYQHTSKYIEPFKKLNKSKSKWFGLIKEFNFNLIPSTIGVKADINRQYGRFIPRIVNTDLTGKYKVERVDTTYDKYFNFDRFYTVRWDVSKSLNLDFNAVNNARVDEPYGALDTKAKKDSVKDNFFNGGRSFYYTQKSIASYTLPLSKFPLTDWITARYSYNTFYNWIGASRVAVELGNSLENGQDNTMTAQFDLSKLYNKSRFLRSIENPLPKGMSPQPVNDLLKNLPTKEEALKDLKGKARDVALTKWKKQRRDARASMLMQKQNQQMAIGGFVQGLGRVVTMLKTVQINYTEGYKSRVPGWMDSTQVFGQNFKSMEPGLDYVFGKQPDAKWLERKAAQGLFTRDSNFNLFFSQKFEQKLSLTAQLEPIKELTIDVTLDKTFSKDYQELYKDTLFNNTSNAKTHLNPSAMGGFSVSFVSFNTLFGSRNPNEVSDIFKTFESYRPIISQRIAKSNAYWINDPNSKIDADGYATGYNKHHQDVLIPAFIAAYTKQDPNTVSLVKHDNSKIKNNPFSGITPKPNWRISYTGLTKIGNLASTFSSINLSHQYSGTLSMNSFNSALQFSDPLLLGVPKFRNNDTGNYIPFFLVPNITIQEQFQPLIGIDVTTTSQLNLKFEYKKSRTLSLSLIDYQLAETNSTEWTVGGSFRKKGVRLPGFLMKLITKKPRLDNDLSFKLDLSMRDDYTTNSRLDQPNAYGTGGQKVVTIQPSIDYVLNNRLNIKFFFDQRKVIPYISTSAPTTNTRAGVQLRISLQ
ncbi:MAG: cell surface protein SprA [Bacteroidetes bacterium]|nr:cell surface protein SprA [Bacteroidota bacterium]